MGTCGLMDANHEGLASVGPSTVLPNLGIRVATLARPWASSTIAPVGAAVNSQGRQPLEMSRRVPQPC